MTPSRQHQLRIVLVDDHPQVLRALSRLLEPSCDVVASVGTGKDGLKTAVRLMPDVMVVDLPMPEMDGLELCRYLKKLAPEMNVIIITAFDEEEIESVVFEAGASAFVPKHCASSTLENVIHNLVEKMPTQT